MRPELEQRVRIAGVELEHALLALRRRGPHRRRLLAAALASTLHAAALLSHVRRELELELDPWHGKGSPWSSF